jgi:hypothetical protein
MEILSNNLRFIIKKKFLVTIKVSDQAVRKKSHSSSFFWKLNLNLFRYRAPLEGVLSGLNYIPICIFT